MVLYFPYCSVKRKKTLTEENENLVDIRHTFFYATVRFREIFIWIINLLEKAIFKIDIVLEKFIVDFNDESYQFLQENYNK